MSFDARKYSRAFELLAKKIIEYSINEKTIISEVTKETRDEGIDVIIKLSNNLITVEAKLRNEYIRLALKDIATSIIFYMLRINDTHYIISNVYLTKGTIDILNQINLKDDYNIKYICGKDTLYIINQIYDKLGNTEKELADILLKNFSQESFIENKEYSSIRNDLISFQKKYVKKIQSSIKSGQKCTIVSGTIGCGKSTITRYITDKLEDSLLRIIYIDCQSNDTIEKFIYQISNAIIGIDINILMKKYLDLSTKVYLKAEGLHDPYEVLSQVFSNRYLDNIEFLAKNYIDRLLKDFFVYNIVIVLDNFSYSSIELGRFISDYVVSSSKKIQFCILVDNYIKSDSFEILNSKMSLPVNYKLFHEIPIDELNKEDAKEYITNIYSKINIYQKDILFNMFGGNMLLLKMVIQEIKENPNMDISLLRPYDYKKAIINRIEKYIFDKNTFFLVSFFITWVMNSELNLEQLVSLNNNSKKILLKTLLYKESKGGISFANPYIFRLISKIYITQRETLNKVLIYKDIKMLIPNNPISNLRISFFFNKDFIKVAKESLVKFNDKGEYSYIVETYAYMYLYSKKSKDKINKINAAADLLYSLIDYKNDFIVDVLDLSQITQELDEQLVYSLNDTDNSDINLLCDAKLKYSIFLYFNYKRNNKMKKAQEILLDALKYVKHSKDPLLISKTIRFTAISYKENGDRKSFLKILRDGMKENADNLYLVASYYANIASKICYSNPKIAYSIVKNTAVPAAIKTDAYLHLWLLNDLLIYNFYNKLQTYEEYQKECMTIEIITKRLNSLTDTARIHNTWGCICLYFGDYKEAKKQLSLAVYSIWHHEPNNILFYFTSNYLQLVEDIEEEKEIIDFMYQWINDNLKYIKDKILDKECKPTKNKMSVAINSFLKHLQLRSDYRYNTLYNTINKIGINTLNEIDKSFLIKGKNIILF